MRVAPTKTAFKPPAGSLRAVHASPHLPDFGPWWLQVLPVPPTGNCASALEPRILARRLRILVSNAPNLRSQTLTAERRRGHTCTPLTREESEEELVASRDASSSACSGMAKNWYLGTRTVACACACCCTRDLVLVLVLVLNQVSIQVLSACTFRRLYQGGGTGTR